MVIGRIMEVDPTPELGSFPKEASHASPRTFRRPVRPSATVVAGAAPPRQGWQALAGPPRRHQRRPVDPAHWRTLARPAPTLRQMEHRLLALQALAARRHLDAAVLHSAGRARRPGADRPRTVV